MNVQPPAAVPNRQHRGAESRPDDAAIRADLGRLRRRAEVMRRQAWHAAAVVADERVASQRDAA